MPSKVPSTTPCGTSSAPFERGNRLSYKAFGRYGTGSTSLGQLRSHAWDARRPREEALVSSAVPGPRLCTSSGPHQVTHRTGCAGWPGCLSQVWRSHSERSPSGEVAVRYSDS